MEQAAPPVDSPRLKITVSSSTTSVIVTLAGELDMSTTALLAFELGQVFAQPQPSRVVLDLSGLEFCDSSGLGALVWCGNAWVRSAAGWR